METGEIVDQINGKIFGSCYLNYQIVIMFI